MSKPPKIVIPGLNRGAGVPAGYVLGRRKGVEQGPVELLDLGQLRTLGIAAASDTNRSIASLSTAVSTVLGSFNPGGGSEGEDGSPGPPGARGDAGAPGTPGAIGPTGPPGFGIDGIDGEDGASIPGTPGAPGAAGTAGATGPQGPIGFAIDGLDGDEGMPIPGTPGAAGTAGATGAAGGTFNTLSTAQADSGNGTTVETDIFTYTITAGQLAANGDRVEMETGGTFLAHATATRRIRAYFGGTLVYDSGALTIATTDAWSVVCSVIRVSASVVRCTTSILTETAAVAEETQYTEVTGLTLANTQIIKVTGTAAGVGAATNDIICKAGAVEFKSATGGVSVGTAFPGSPTTGTRFFRTDRNIEYVYDGTRWLSAVMLRCPITPAVAGFTATSASAGWACNPEAALYDMYVETAYFTKVLNGVGNWTAKIQTEDGATTADLTNATTGAFTNTTRDSVSITVNQVVSSTIDEFLLVLTENSGTATCFITAGFRYRLIG